MRPNNRPSECGEGGITWNHVNDSHHSITVVSRLQGVSDSTINKNKYTNSHLRVDVLLELSLIMLSVPCGLLLLVTGDSTDDGVFLALKAIGGSLNVAYDIDGKLDEKDEGRSEGK